MSDPSKVNPLSFLPRLKNKKITDSLPIKKQVSSEKLLEKDYNKPIEMDLSETPCNPLISSDTILHSFKDQSTIFPNQLPISKPLSNSLLSEQHKENIQNFQQYSRRPIQDLFCEFNMPCPANFKGNCETRAALSSLSSLSGPLGPLESLPVLTPVREEAESNQSSGQNNYKRPDPSRIAQNETFSCVGTEGIYETKEKKEEYTLFGEKTRKNNEIFYESFNSQEEMKVFRKRLEEERKDLMTWQKRANKMKSLVNVVKERLKFWSRLENQSGLIDEFIKNCKELPSSIDFKESSYRFHERWKKTITETINGVNIDYFCHKSSFALDPILGKLVVGIFFSTSGEPHINLILSCSFSNSLVDFIWRSSLNYLSSIASLETTEKILEKISTSWVKFVVFSSRFDFLNETYEMHPVKIKDRCIFLKESLSSEDREYHLTFYAIYDGVDIFEDYKLWLKNNSNCN